MELFDQLKTFMSDTREQMEKISEDVKGMTKTLKLSAGWNNWRINKAAWCSHRLLEQGRVNPACARISCPGYAEYTNTNSNEKIRRVILFTPRLSHRMKWLTFLTFTS